MIRNPKIALALLTALNLLNFADRFVLSAVIAPLQDDLGLSGLSAGMLSTVFLIGYFATSPIFGVLGDRSARPTVGRGGPGRRRTLMAAGVAVWSVATLATGAARNLASIVTARTLVGVGEASYGTLAPTVIDEMAPPSGVARWMAVFSAAMPVGAALGYLIGGTVLKAHGWRFAFWVAGAPGLVLAALCMMLADPMRQRAPSAAPSETGAAGPWALVSDAARLWRVPLYRGVVLGYAAYTFAIGGFSYWAPKYLHVQYLLDAGRASQIFGLLTVLGGIVGTLAGGWAADRLVARALSRAGELADDGALDEIVARCNLRLTAWATGLGAPLAAASIASPSATMFFACAFPCQVALFASNGPINLAILRSAPPTLRAVAMSVAIFAIHALGDLWSPPLIGLVSDFTSMRTAMGAVPVVFAIGAIVWARASAASGWLTWGTRVR